MVVGSRSNFLDLWNKPGRAAIEVKAKPVAKKPSRRGKA